jgi:hypothetical protein
MGRLVLSSAVSWFLGAKFHSGRTAQKLKAKHQKEQKALYSQYYNDVRVFVDRRDAPTHDALSRLPMHARVLRGGVANQRVIAMCPQRFSLYRVRCFLRFH